MIVLGIESSCDETAVAIVDDKKQIISNLVYSQIKEHISFGGVVPEVAARSHMEVMPVLYEQALAEASISYDQLDGVAVTAGPGLIGGVMVGLIFAKTVASVARKPFVAINHLEGHALTARLTDNVEFPYLLLLISGGHCQFLLVNGVGKYQMLSTTVDDAVGESFDKVAKMLNLEYPGGPNLEKMAAMGNANRFNFPCPMCEPGKMDMSFSGLKTAVRQVVEKHSDDLDKVKYDICASFQKTIADVLSYKTSQIMDFLTKNGVQNVVKFVVAGGVAANQYLRSSLNNIANVNNYELIAPPINLCTDNAAMIAWAGIENLQNGIQHSLDFAPRARWAL